MYATFNREGHSLDGATLSINGTYVSSVGDVYLYAKAEELEEECLFLPGEFSNWFRVTPHGQKIYRDEKLNR
jgi:hypothetical protein